MREKREIGLGLAEFYMVILGVMVVMAIAKGLHAIADALHRIAEVLK